MLKKLLKSALVIALVAASGAGASAAYFTSTATVPNNQIVVGTLRLALDSTRTHFGAPTWNGGAGPQGVPFDSYTMAEDVDGVSTFYNTLETWTNAAPGPYAAYTNQAGADVLPDGNKSYWVSLRNNGSIPMKVSANVNSGNWVMDPGVAATPACSAFDPNSVNVVTVPNVTFYGTTGMSNICKGHEECENIYYGLTSVAGGSNVYSTDLDIQGADVNITPSSSTVYATTNGTNAGSVITLNGGEFVIARVDANFDTSNNCFQGATYTYNLTGNAYQVADPTW